MDKKDNKIEISVSALISFILLVVVIILGYYIYNYKKTTNETISELEEKNAFMQNNVDELQGKINNISSIVTNSGNIVDKEDIVNTSDNSKQTNIDFSDAEVKVALQNYLSLYGKCVGSPASLLVDLGLLKNEDIQSLERTKTDDNYIKTEINYDDFVNEMKKYTTEKCMEENFIHHNTTFKNKNGLLYYFDGGASGLQYDVDSIKKSESHSKHYTAVILDTHFDKSVDKLNIEFTVETYNGKCVIDSIEFKN